MFWIKKMEMLSNLAIQQNNKGNVYRAENQLELCYLSCPMYTQSGRGISCNWKVDQDNQKKFEGINGTIVVEGNRIIFQRHEEKFIVDINGEASFRPNFNGVVVESKQSRLSLKLSMNHKYNLVNNGKYIYLMENANEPIIIFNLHYYLLESGQPMPLSINVLSYSNNEIDLDIYFDDEERGILSFEIDLYSKKIFFDSTIESLNSEDNNAFGCISFLGYTEKYGEQQLYMRFDPMQFKDLRNDRIESATLYIKKYSSQKCKLIARRITNPWCSFGVTWGKRVSTSYRISESIEFQGYILFDITLIIKEICKNNIGQDPGMMIRAAGEDDFAVLATGDNYTDPPFIIIKIKK